MEMVGEKRKKKQIRGINSVQSLPDVKITLRQFNYQLVGFLVVGIFIFFIFFLSLCISYRTGVCEGTLWRHCFSRKCSHTSLHAPTQCSPSLSHMVQRLRPRRSAHGCVCCHCDCKRRWEKPSLLFSAGEWWRGVLLCGQQQLLRPHQSHIHNRSADCAR